MKKKLKGLLLAVATVAFTAALAVPAMALADEAEGSSFADVEGDEWFAADVEWANESGLMTGTGDGTNFEPNIDNTRAMFVTSLHRLEGEPAATAADARVPEGAWYTDAALWALEAGVLEGYDDGNLGLSDPLTREQTAVFAYRYAAYKGYDLSEAGDTNVLSYLDAFDIGEWAMPAVQWACGEGLLRGYTDADGNLTGYLGPKDPASRAQTAAVLHRLVDDVVIPNTEKEEDEPVVIPHYHSYAWSSNGDGTHTGTCPSDGATMEGDCAFGEDLLQGTYGSHYVECEKCGYELYDDCEYDSETGKCACGSEEGCASVSSAADLLAILEGLSEGDEIEVTLEGDVELDEPLEIPAGATVVLDLGDNTISGAQEKGAGAIIDNKGDLTIKGGTVENTTKNGDSVISNSGTLVLDKATVIGAPAGDAPGYPAYAIATSGKLTVEDGTSITSDRGAIGMEDGADVVINGGKFTTTDAMSDRAITLHTIAAKGSGSKIVIKGGSFENKYAYGSDTGSSVICPWGASVSVYGGEFSYFGTGGQGGVFQNYMGYSASVNVYGGTYDDKTFEKHLASGYTVTSNDDGTWTVGRASASSSAELSSAIASGKKVELTENVTWSSEINSDADIDLAGNTFEATYSYKLVNNADLTMKGGDYVVNSTYGCVDVRPDSEEGSVVVFEGVNFSYNMLNKTYGPSTNRLGSVVEVCATVADAHTEIVFRNCTFDNAMVLFEGLSGKTGSFTATFENCTFDCLTSSAPIYVQNYVTGTITVKDCTFNIEATSSSASAISVSPSTSTSVTVIAEGNTINAVAATPSGEDGTVEQIKVNGTPANIKLISFYGNTTVNETNTTATGIAVSS